MAEQNHADKSNTEKPAANNPPGTYRRLPKRRIDFSDFPVDEAEDELSSDCADRLLLMLEQNTEEERQRAREKWNFDFVNELPLAGDWEWEKVAPSVPKKPVAEIVQKGKEMEELKERSNEI